MKKYNNKAIVFLLSIFLLSTSSLLLLNARADLKASQDINLTIYVTDQQISGVKNVIDDFLASPMGSGVNNVTAVSTGEQANDQLTFLQALMQGGTATSAVIGIDTAWTAQFAENGWIIPLDSYLETGEMDDYVQGIVDASTYNGKVYAYPYFLNLGLLWYRTDLLDQHMPGWTMANFSTWESLNRTANYILNNESGLLTEDDADLVGYIAQLDAYEGGVVNFFEWAGSNGATELISSDGVVNINTAKVQEAMDFISGLVPPQFTGVQGSDYIIPRYGLVYDEGSSIGKWTANESIFMRQWTFAYGASVDAGMEYGVNFDVAPLPHFEGATGYKTSEVGGAILGIPKDTTGTAREAAVNLTKFLGDTLAQNEELVNVSNFPALKSVYDSPPSGYEWIANVTDQLNLTLARPVRSDYSDISVIIADYFSDLLSGNKKVTTALSEMQRDVVETVSGSPAVPGFSVGILIISAISMIGIIAVRKFKHI